MQNYLLKKLEEITKKIQFHQSELNRLTSQVQLIVEDVKKHERNDGMGIYLTIEDIFSVYPEKDGNGKPLIYDWSNIEALKAVGPLDETTIYELDYTARMLTDNVANLRMVLEEKKKKEAAELLEQTGLQEG